MARTLQMEEKRIICKMMDNYVCGDYVFNSNFDSGNLGQVELVRSCPDSEPAENIVFAEFNAWTTPDCYGTPNESPNRTWFFFSIKGGRPNRNVKINIKNLNRQAKLFSQGMQPVVRIGPYGKWERIKEKPVCGMEAENFCMSFIHRPLDIPHIEHYYAFTYPFTYTECQNMLEKFERKYQKNDNDLNYIIQRILNPGVVVKRNRQQTEIVALYTKGESISSSGYCTSPNSPEFNISSSTQTESESAMYEQYSEKELQSEIYYHRELLIYSLEGRRVDLVTISSFHGITDQREEKLPNLFPENKNRCHVFKDKKIIFLSSRVHPGETPASFVLNGFVNLLLDRKSVIASTLRQLYVFKIVPILNPDGVFRGHYRTDTLGQNLNRMYINPKIETHPSIYAVKKLIKFYHLGYDACEDNNLGDASSSDTHLKNDSSSSSLSLDNCVPKVEVIIEKDDTVNALENRTSSDSFKDCTSSEGEEYGARINNNDSEINRKNVKTKVFTDKLIPEIKTTAQEPTAKKSNQLFSKKSSEVKLKKSSGKQILGSIHNSSGKVSELKSKDYYQVQQRVISKRVPQKKDLKTGSVKNLSASAMGHKSANKKNILSTFNITSNMTSRSNSLNLERGNNDEKSNMFLYIDFHGHASKKGVFMYGNHFPNYPEAVECMLLPRLMGINCHHFHYDACNFSERNMYRREKRDGLSKEGSGRVAVYKMTGLIKSYTLESNYNTGKYINILPARGKDNSIKVMNIIPPKYTPATYEEVGRALAPSILDLTNSNCLSRIHNSDFRSLQGMRINLKNEIERNISNRSASSHATAKVISAHENLKRIKRQSLSASSTLPSTETAKENKASFSGPWETDSTTVSSGNKIIPPTVPPKTQLKPNRTAKKSSLKVRSSTFFGRRESCKKKSKVLAESTSSSSKKDQQFHVPTKKAKVTTQTDTAQISAPKTLKSQKKSIFSHKSPVHDSSIKSGVSNSSDDVKKLGDALMQNNNCFYVDVGTSTDEIFFPCRSSDTEYEDCKPVDASNSACSIVKLSKGVNNSSSSIVTILTTTAIVDDAVPSCSGMALPTTHAIGFRKNITAEKYVAKGRDISSNVNLKVHSAFGGSEKSKLLRKKRSVLRDTALLKRKKSKFKNSLH